MIRSRFSREIFHPLLPDAAWNSFRSGDYDTAVFEAFKAVETAVLKKGIGKNGIIASDHGRRL
jgi:HEPN domain-containing protein